MLLDHTDRQIVGLLHQDGRRSNVEIARAVGVSEGTVRKRIDRLLSTDKLRIRGLVEPQTVGLRTRAMIFLDIDLAQLSAASQLISEMPEVLSVKWLTGDHDLLIEAAFETDDHLASFLNDRISRIEGVRRSQTAHVLRVEKEPHEWSVPPGPEPTVLVVDDDPDFVEAARLILEPAGYRIDSASNGTEALKAMIASPPDLVILDIMMDGVLDGWDASWRIRSNPLLHDMPILVVSSITSSDYLSMFPTDEDHLIDNFLSKPVAPDRLLSEVRRLLERSEKGSSA